MGSVGLRQDALKFTVMDGSRIVSLSCATIGIPIRESACGVLVPGTRRCCAFVVTLPNILSIARLAGVVWSDHQAVLFFSGTLLFRSRSQTGQA